MNPLKLVGGPYDGKAVVEVDLVDNAVEFPIRDDYYLLRTAEGTYSWTSHNYVLKDGVLRYTGMLKYYFNPDTGMKDVERVA